MTKQDMVNEIINIVVLIGALGLGVIALMTFGGG